MAFVEELARGLVAEVAPDELPVFEVVSAGYAQDPARVLGRDDYPGSMLGSGFDTVVLLVTPAALAVATAVHQHLMERASEFTVNSVIRVARKRWGSWQKKPEPVRETTEVMRDEAVAGTRKLVEELTGDAASPTGGGEVIRILLRRRADAGCASGTTVRFCALISAAPLGRWSRTRNSLRQATDGAWRESCRSAPTSTTGTWSPTQTSRAGGLSRPFESGVATPR
jgi:hypothetical protein